MILAEPPLKKCDLRNTPILSVLKYFLMAKILITGGAGFIGSNFIHHVLQTYPEIEVVNLDALTYAGNLANLKDIEKDPRYTFIQGDITDEKCVNRAFKEHQPSVVFNFAAETHVDRSIHGPKAFIMTDVLGTYTLLEAVKTHATPLYIQISTDEVYGSTHDGEFTEESPFLPNSPYSASKAGGDHLVRAYHHTYGLPVIAIHSCNVFGPYQFPEKVIPRFVTNLIQGKKVPIYGTGQNVREWIFTQDFCHALDFVWQKAKPGEVFNIGTGQRIPNLELTTKILHLLEKGSDQIEYVADRLGHDFRYALSAEKIRALGWKPTYDFDAALQLTVEWYKTHESWWKPLLPNSSL